MNFLHQNAQLSNIYQSLAFLNISELDGVMQHILSLRREKLPSVLSHSESELLRKINATAPAYIQKRYDLLFKKRTEETINESEYAELLELTSFMENFNVNRLEYLVELAKLRNVTLDKIIEELQIQPKLYVA